MATDIEVPTPPAQDHRPAPAFIDTKPGYPPLHRLSVEQYHRMIEVGIIPSGAPVELIEGLLVRKMSINPPHFVSTSLLGHRFHALIPEGWFVTMANPVTLEGQQSEPEPDAQVVRGTPRDYLARKPTPADAALVIEVSDSSYRFDRQVKWANYAAAGVPVYWIVDLNRRRLEIHADPSPEGYRSCLVLGPDDEAPLVLDAREVARLRVADVLP